jgi:hypothetical protein
MAAEKIKKEQITKPTAKAKKTLRGKQISKMMIEGKKRQEICETMNISPATFHRELIKNETILQTLDKAGITDEYLAQKHRELLESQRKLYNPKTQTFEDVPDNNARNTALSIGYRVRGHLKDNPENNTAIQINLVKYSPEVQSIPNQGIELNSQVVDMVDNDSKDK